MTPTPILLPNDEHFWANVFPKKEPYVLRCDQVGVNFSLHDVTAVLQTAELLKKDIYIVENEKGTYLKDYYVGHLNPDATWVERIEEINKAFRNRYVIKVQGMERWNQEFSELCSLLEKKVGGWVDAHLYLAPSQGGSFGVHTDPQDVFVYVLRGHKRFDLPDHNLTVELKAGDWLYIPKDAKHKGESITNSVMVSFGVKNYLCDSLRAPVEVGPWYSSLMHWKPTDEWYRQMAAIDDGNCTAGRPSLFKPPNCS